MDRYSYCWIRDSNGPVRYLLACGDYDAVRRYLDYQFRGYAQQGKVNNNLPLALKLPESAPQVDWTRAPVPGAEIASFMILQRYWYWRHTADDDLLRAQWPMLRRCLLGQKVDARGTLPFFAMRLTASPAMSSSPRQARSRLGTHAHAIARCGNGVHRRCPGPRRDGPRRRSS